MNSPPDFKSLLLLLTTALGYAFVVERILETLGGLLDRWVLKRPPLPAKSARAEDQLVALKKEAEQRHLTKQSEKAAELLVALKTASGRQKAKLEKAYHSLLDEGADPARTELPEETQPNLVLVDPAEPPDWRKTVKTFWFQIIGTLTGILLCSYSRFGIFVPIGLFEQLPPLVDWIFTGILIGSGSQPVHFLIRFVTQRKVVEMKVSAEKSIQPAESIPPKAPAVHIPAYPYFTPLSIPYRGGVEPEKLEFTHLRPANPDLIVIHHTAMHSDSTFADVVRVIRQKGWLTGYHCVVLKDGSIHPFCRWDRYGSHVKGYNRRSLGLAFNGNFETDPTQPYSNAEGKLGITRPTEEQLHAGAAVTALWCLLYNIKPDFENSILRHNQLAEKACPGSHFPIDAFHRLVETYLKNWQIADQARREMDIFRSKPYIYV